MLPRCDVRWAAVSPLARDLAVGGPADDGRTTSRSSPTRSIPTTWSHRRGTLPSTVAVAYLGAPRRYKGFDLLPDIIEETQRLVAADWLVFSHQTDDDLDATWRRLRTMATDGRVSLEGKFPDVRAVYARCDVVVCPSVLESFCRVGGGGDAERHPRRRQRPRARSVRCSATTRRGCCSRWATRSGGRGDRPSGGRRRFCGPASARPDAGGPRRTTRRSVRRQLLALYGIADVPGRCHGRGRRRRARRPGAPRPGRRTPPRCTDQRTRPHDAAARALTDGAATPRS